MIQTMERQNSQQDIFFRVRFCPLHLLASFSVTDVLPAQLLPMTECLLPGVAGVQPAQALLRALAAVPAVAAALPLLPRRGLPGVGRGPPRVRLSAALRPDRPLHSTAPGGRGGHQQRQLAEHAP